MSRPPAILAEKKVRIVLSVLQGEVSVAGAARREKVSEQVIGNWKRQFLEAGWEDQPGRGQDPSFVSGGVTSGRGRGAHAGAE